MATSTAPKRNVHQDPGARPTSTDRLNDGMLLSTAAEAQRAATRQQRRRLKGAGHFIRHLGEMVLAMMVGMMALGALDGVILSVAGTSVAHVRNSVPEVVALAMAFNMTVGMTAWMRYRRHAWAMCAEMAGAMFAPAMAAIVLFWCAVIHGGSVATVEMTAMLPTMLAVMLLRLTEYSQPVHAHARKATG
jgi:hypothetical protein